MRIVSKKKPEWLRMKVPGGDKVHEIKSRLRDKKLFTVCEEARCPNMGECWSEGTATLMILGDTCTRGCRFCNVKSGNPRGWLDPQEAKNSADTVVAMDLNYVVVTCVDRDDLPDGGAGQFADVIRAIQDAKPDCLIEVLTSDYRGNREHIATVADARPDVFAHNLETVRRLTPSVRDPRAGYDQSLDVLAWVKDREPERITKSSLMLGLGETREEILEAMRDMRRIGVDVVTMGQYLRPSRKHLEVVEYVAPERFEDLAEEARAMGFLYVAAGPLVRSSYKAGEYFLANHLARQKALALRGDREPAMTGPFAV
ncbi:lipoyl synthase [Sulfidibacter corallicola]|uniref:Lipoyl synthase n=1 Tax=Sulfidibacter corallicola TaxID=2818388 RepID=A0A8A4TVP8_SULCO|nr:lipoyl synthase [Sulfidibacter corallicola]QTD53204.1 lipoyl synthase [Sulfidibacter corallicola]